MPDIAAANPLTDRQTRTQIVRAARNTDTYKRIRAACQTAAYSIDLDAYATEIAATVLAMRGGDRRDHE